jgi:hypothetical protein
VAPVAIAAEIAVVNIVTPVAVDTASAPVGNFFERPVVTAVTMSLAVSMPEFEIGFVMIESPYQPVVGVVA